MEERHIIPVYIPDGCAGYVQPMNTILNNLVKDKTADILEELLEADEEIDDSVGHRSIMITQCSWQAWLWLPTEKKDSIIKSFKQAGSSLSPDGTEDTKLYIRGLPDITVGPWQLDTLDSDEEVEFMAATPAVDAAEDVPIPVQPTYLRRISISALCT